MSEGDALVFARCAGFVFRAPGFSHPAVPPPVRAGLALALALALRSNPVPQALDGPTFAAALASELTIGAAVGMAASMLYDGAYAGGRAVDDYVGIRGSVPSAAIVAPSGFGRVWSLAFATGYFGLGAYRIALEAFARTFETLPPGATIVSRDLETLAISLPVTLLRAAVLVAGPAITVAFLVQTALAGLSRIVPRLTTFALSFPIVFGCAVLVTIASLPFTLGASGVPWFDLSAIRGRR